MGTTETRGYRLFSRTGRGTIASVAATSYMRTFGVTVLLWCDVVWLRGSGPAWFGSIYFLGSNERWRNIDRTCEWYSQDWGRFPWRFWKKSVFFFSVRWSQHFLIKHLCRRDSASTTGTLGPDVEKKMLSKRKLRWSGISLPYRKLLNTSNTKFFVNGSTWPILRAVRFSSTRTRSTLTPAFNQFTFMTQGELYDHIVEGERGWVLQSVVSRASFRRATASGQKAFTVLSLHINNVFAKKKGIAKKVIQTIRAIMISQDNDLVACDFTGTAWRCRRRDNLSSIDEVFSDGALPTPPGPTPLWWPESIRNNWADVCGFLNMVLFSIPRHALGSRSSDQSCHHETWLHLHFVDWNNKWDHQAHCNVSIRLKERPVSSGYRAQKRHIIDVLSDHSLSAWIRNHLRSQVVRLPLLIITMWPVELRCLARPPQVKQFSFPYSLVVHIQSVSLRSSCAKKNRLVHHLTKTNTSMKSLPSQLSSLHRSHLIVQTPSNISLIVRSSVFLMECQLSEQFFSMNTDDSNIEDMNVPHTTECFSLSSVTFIEDRFCLFCTRSFTLFWEWPGSQRQFQFCFVLTIDELLCSSLNANNGSPRSIVIFFFFQTDVLVFTTETWLELVCPCPRAKNGCHRSIIHQFISFPLLRRPSFLIVPSWVACCVSRQTTGLTVLSYISACALRGLWLW